MEYYVRLYYNKGLMYDMETSIHINFSFILFIFFDKGWLICDLKIVCGFVQSSNHCD